MSRLTRDGTAEPVSRDQILRHARGQGNAHFPCSADHEQDWQPYPVDPYSAICDDHTYIHTYYVPGGLSTHTINRCEGYIITTLQQALETAVYLVYSIYLLKQLSGMCIALFKFVISVKDFRVTIYVD